MDKVGIVILNYLNYKDTIECIESLRDEEYENKQIIVVDNCSANESWDELNKLYKNSNIHILKTNKNLGFAKGNNIGISYALETLKCDHVLVANNDTIFKDKKIINELLKAYSPGVGVIGPKIVARNGKNQNPVPKKVTKYNAQKELRVFKNKKTSLDNSIVSRLIYKLKYKIELKMIKNEDINLVLHGSCMLLTKDYFIYYPYLYPNTFLYYEEDILALITKKVSLKKKYIDTTWIYHKEDQSSEVSFGNQDSVKLEFMINSAEQCMGLFDESYETIKSKYFN